MEAVLTMASCYLLRGWKSINLLLIFQPLFPVSYFKPVFICLKYVALDDFYQQEILNPQSNQVVTNSP